MARNGVKDEIINFDARRISPDVNKKVSALVKNKQSSFDPKVGGFGYFHNFFCDIEGQILRILSEARSSLFNYF